jgi:hypothetical protein
MPDETRPICCFTSFTYSYLARARILARTLRQAHPDWCLHALLVDEPPPDTDVTPALAEFDVVMHASELRIPRFRSWLFKHDIVEACTAVKGQMLTELLEAGWQKVVYLDPDIAVFHPLDEVIGRLDTHSIVLTPHQTEPNETLIAVGENELTSMRYGTYNLGFVAVRNDKAGRSFGAWWAGHLYRACYDAVETGIFTDQKYCDLVPGLFDGVFIERDPGYNVASWNLSRRKLRLNREHLLANGSLLRFYHFTKFGGIGDHMTERYAAENTEVFEVWQWYKRTLRSTAVAGIPKHYWAFGHFSNGQPIPKAVRVFYRGRPDLGAYFDNPFEVEGDSLYHWLQREAPEVFMQIAA